MNGEIVDFPASINPVQTTVVSATRTWTDANGDFVPQENELGPLSNSSFGQVVIRTRYDDAVRHGFGVRGFNWETSAGIDHELLRGVSVNAAYFRRWFGNFLATDNLLVAPSDYDPLCITAPVDPRLPGGGGQQVCGLYDITPAKFGQSNNLVTFAKNYGEQTQVYDGIDLTMNARLPRAMLISGGLNAGRTATNRCFVVDSTEELRFCKVSPPFQPQVKFLGTFPLKWGLQASGTFQSLPGPQITASLVVPNEQIRGSLGRDLAAGARGTKTVDLIAPGTVFGDRLCQVDFRMSKVITVRSVGVALGATWTSTIY